MNKIRKCLFILLVVIFVACNEEQVEPINRRMSISVELPSSKTITRIGLATNANSADVATFFHSDEVLELFIKQGNLLEKATNISFTISDQQAKHAKISFDIPEKINPQDTYSIYGIGGGANTMIADDNGKDVLVVSLNARCYPIKDFRAEYILTATVTDGSVKQAKCELFGSYLIYHIKNESSSDASCILEGYKGNAVYLASLWAEEMGFIESTGSVNTRSYEFSVPSGTEEQVVYNAVSSGNGMNELSVNMTINGQDVSSPLITDINKVLQQGHAYHIHLIWDGTNLKFENGNDAISRPGDDLPSGEINPDNEAPDVGL